MSHAHLADYLNQAADFYRDQLLASQGVIAYLKGRGISGAVAARYRMGFAPGGSKGLRTTFADYADSSLIDCGLVIAGDGGRFYDRFRERVMFPILSAGGDVIGFGGRVLDSQAPKYLNSPETPLFHKCENLFGVPQAAAAIRETGTVFVVEGYMDVVGLAQRSVQNSVATMGTATSEHHVKSLMAMAQRIVFCFDGDDAGQRAAAQALEVSLPLVDDATDIRFLFLPTGHDPDSFVLVNGEAAFRALAAEAMTLEDFFMQQAREGTSLKYAEDRAKLVAQAMPGLQQLRAEAIQGRLLDALSKDSGMDVEDLISVCGLYNF
jgi:DNA primase